MAAEMTPQLPNPNPTIHIPAAQSQDVHMAYVVPNAALAQLMYVAHRGVEEVGDRQQMASAGHSHEVPTLAPSPVQALQPAVAAAVAPLPVPAPVSSTPAPPVVESGPAFEQSMSTHVKRLEECTAMSKRLEELVNGLANYKERISELLCTLLQNIERSECCA